MNEKGVSLVELLIVIVVLGIIASISVISVSNIIESTKVRADEANVIQLNQVTRLYTLSNPNSTVLETQTDAHFLINYLFEQQYINTIVTLQAKDGFFSFDQNLKLWLYKGQYIVDTEVIEFDSDGRGNFIDKPYTGTSTTIVIPDKINGTIVELIMSDAFNANNTEQTVKLTSVSFTNASQLNRIHARAFANNNLTTVTLPNTITRIDLRAFRDNQIHSIILPNNLEIIEQEAFNANPLTSIRVGNNLTTTGSNAFGVYTESFKTAYLENGSGLYILNNTNWEKVSD